MNLNLKNTVKTLPFVVDPKRTFVKLHQVGELDYVLDKVKLFFQRKYNVDYFSVHMFNNAHDCLAGRYNYDNWHDWLQQDGSAVQFEFLQIDQIAKMTPDSLILDFFDFFDNEVYRSANHRAEIFGHRNHHGLTLKCSNDVNDKTVYDVTFKDDANLAKLPEAIVIQFMNDLKKCQNVLKLFVDYVAIHNNFSDQHAMKVLMTQWHQDFQFLL